MNGSNVVDFMYLTGSGSNITANKISGTLSVSRTLLAATTITYNGIDYAVFGGGDGPNVVDFMYLTGSGSSISSDKISGTLSAPRYNLGATTITYNGIDYAVFGGGYGGENSAIVDFMYLTTEDSKIKINKISGTLSAQRYNLGATTITYNGIDYAVFGGGYGGENSAIVDFMYLTTEDSKIKINKISGTLSEARADLAATTITYNGVEYAVFGGGNNDVVDFMYLSIDPTSTII